MTIVGEMRRFRRTVIVGLHRTLGRPLIVPLLDWLSVQPFVIRAAAWLTLRRAVLLGVALGLLLYWLAGPTVRPDLLR
jgi:hypothetical protein